MPRSSLRRQFLSGALGSIVLGASTASRPYPPVSRTAWSWTRSPVPPRWPSRPTAGCSSLARAVCCVSPGERSLATPALILSGVSARTSERGLLGDRGGPGVRRQRIHLPLLHGERRGLPEPGLAIRVARDERHRAAREVVLLDNIHVDRGQPQRRRPELRQRRLPLRQRRRRRVRLPHAFGCAGANQAARTGQHPDRQDPAHHPRRRRASRQSLRWARAPRAAASAERPTG